MGRSAILSGEMVRGRRTVGAGNSEVPSAPPEQTRRQGCHAKPARLRNWKKRNVMSAGEEGASSGLRVQGCGSSRSFHTVRLVRDLVSGSNSIFGCRNFKRAPTGLPGRIVVYAGYVQDPRRNSHLPHIGGIDAVCWIATGLSYIRGKALLHARPAGPGKQVVRVGDIGAGAAPIPKPIGGNAGWTPIFADAKVAITIPWAD